MFICVYLWLIALSLTHAQTYPTKPVRIVTAEVGSGNDLASRAIALNIGGGMGQPFIVDNRGFMGSEIVMKAAPDGYTLLCYGAPMWLSPFLRARVPWDPLKDFAPITLTVETPNLLVLHPAVAAKTLEELLALARAKPGELNYGSSSVGATPHLAAEMFRAMTGIHIVRVPYKGSGPAFIDLMAGQIQVLFSSTVSSMPHVKTGKVRGLAITSLKRAAALPDVPTIAETYAGFESSSWFGLLAPAKTPKAVVDRLLNDTRTALRSTEMRQALVSQGAEPGGLSSAEFANYFQTEIRKWAGVVKSAGVRLEQ